MGTFLPRRSPLSRCETNQLNSPESSNEVTSFHFSGIANVVAKQEILNGYRMTPAEYMPNFLKEIVPNCWQTEPNERPTFHQLVEIIKRQIVDLNSHDYVV